MKYLVDTCAWIEWLCDNKLASSIHKYLKNLEQVAVPTIVQFELYKWICREKDESLALSIVGMTEQAAVLPIDTSLALYAADVARDYRLAMADAIIYAATLKFDLELVTSDKHFKGLKHVKYLAK
ncbi:MAG: PIN domain-containing protein [Legionellaceae bacterium]|nr:PIN domain-containing protein [Legionellaceae bacterium]